MTLHVDDSVSVTLKIQKEFNELQTARITTICEFNETRFRKEFQPHLKPAPFFKIDQASFDYACRAIDKFVLDEYKKEQDVIDAWEKYDKVPDDLKDRLPKLLKPAWDVLTQVNQNTACRYLVLKRPHPDFQELDVTNFSGFKVLGPFTREMKVYYNVIKLSGKVNDIDRFIATFGIGTKRKK